jgi:drug/metabolite transporter (DMT)-like permease
MLWRAPGSEWRPRGAIQRAHAAPHTAARCKYRRIVQLKKIRRDQPGARDTTTNLILVLLLSLIWGCYWPAMKVALREVDVWLFRSVCGLGGGLLFLVIIRLSGQRLVVPRKEWPPLLLATLLNMTLFPLCSLLALKIYAAGAAVIIAYTMPLWVALVSPLVLDERLTRRRVMALCIGFLGIATLMMSEICHFGEFPVGALLVLLGAGFWAGGVVVQKYATWTTPVSVLTAWQLILGAIPFVPISAAQSDPDLLSRISAQAELAWLYSALGGFVLGYYLFYQIISRLTAMVASITSLAVPVVGVLASAVLIGEGIGAAELIALGSVITAVALVLFERR